MNEEFVTLPTGVELCYEQFGDSSDPTVLLIMGLSGPMNWWPTSLCETLATRGFHVVRYDNRDTGRSTKFRDHRVSVNQVAAAYFGRKAPAAYTLDDFAADAIGLLDHLGVDRAHVAGVSMGGMIAQTIALAYPDRLASLTSIMSSTGNRKVGWQHPRILLRMIKGVEPGRDGYIDRAVSNAEAIASPAFPSTHEDRVARAALTYDRGWIASGVTRHMMAILHQPDRTEALAKVTVPTVVVHGTEDVMVHVSGGKATAAAIPDAELWLIPGMGHDLPEQLMHIFANAIERAASRAQTVALTNR